MADKFSFAGLTDLGSLTDLYGNWLKAHSRPEMSADELYYDLLGIEPRPENELLWLAGFIKKWEDIANPEVTIGRVVKILERSL